MMQDKIIFEQKITQLYLWSLLSDLWTLLQISHPPDSTDKRVLVIALVQLLHVWFSPSAFLSMLWYFISTKAGNCDTSTRPGSFSNKRWYKRGDGTESSAGAIPRDMLECGQPYKSTFLLRKINFPHLCNLPVWWEESIDFPLSPQSSLETSVFY